MFIDDFAISRYSEEGIKILYHLIKLRDDLGTSTLFSCQYFPDEWGNQLSDEKECYGKLDGIRRRLTTGFTVLIEMHSFLLEQRSILNSRAKYPLPYIPDCPLNMPWTMRKMRPCCPQKGAVCTSLASRR